MTDENLTGAHAPIVPLLGHLQKSHGKPEATVSEKDFDAFVRAHRSKLIYFLYGHGADLHQAEEAAHTALIEAYRKWESVRSPWNWVRTVALRSYWDACSRRQSERERVIPVDELPDQPGYPPASDQVELTEQEQRICAALAELPPRQREVVELRLEGYSTKEIAQRLGVDSSAVRHNVLRAKSRLRRHRDLFQEDAG